MAADWLVGGLLLIIYESELRGSQSVCDKRAVIVAARRWMDGTNYVKLSFKASIDTFIREKGWITGNQRFHTPMCGNPFGQ